MIKKIIQYLQDFFHKNYAYDVSNPSAVIRVKVKAYNEDNDSFIVEMADPNRYYLPDQYMISRSNIAFPLSEEDKKTIETLTNKPFCVNGYCLKRIFEGRKEIVGYKIISLIENKFLLVQYTYKFLNMILNVFSEKEYQIIKMEDFIVRKDNGVKY
jgi:hypothetical protein